MSSRQFASQLRHQDSVNEVYLASDKQLRPNRNGNFFLQLDLSDRSGSIAARLWNASEKDFASFENGDYVRVEGAAQLFQGSMQMIATSISKVQPAEVNDEDFVVLGSQEIDRMATRLCEILRDIQSPPLRNLAECYLMDETFMSGFTRAPAGVKNHHAYQGGLVEHVTNLMELILRIADRYPELDTDLLLVGALLHDSGKVDELSYERELAYTDQGQLLGHIVLGMAMLDEKIREAEQLSGVTISLNVEKTVRVSFESVSELQGATLTVQLPPGVEISGYEGQREISWSTDVTQGVNILALPLMLREGSGGTIVARIEHSGKSKAFQLDVDVS